nr:EOG090X06NK [Eubosmina coregoni]
MSKQQGPPPAAPPSYFEAVGGVPPANPYVPPAGNPYTQQPQESFGDFNFKRILKENPESRFVAVEGTFDSNSTDPAIVVLEKTHFTEIEVQKILSENTHLQKLFHNDIYGNFLCHPPVELNAVKATIIHPATLKHIEKYSARASYIIEETPFIYESVTLPHIQESQFDNQWIYNILEHKKESDRIIYEDLNPESGFVLLPDLKWDCRTTSNLYVTGIAFKKGIKSIRDLTSEHLPLLTNILEKGSAAISKKFGIPRNQLRIYLHYQPSFYHLHVHFASLQFTPPGCTTERAHLLSSVIHNIQQKSSYYQEALLPFVAFEGDKLLQRYHQHLLENYKFQPAFVDEFYIHLRMPSGVPEGKTRGSDSVEVIGFRGLSGNYQSANKMYIPEKGKCYRIQCAECQAILFDNIHLERVLPLPRASWSEAASDWYCHLHDGESAHQALISRPTDCLYGSSYRSLTSSLIKDGSLTRTGREGREWSCFICQSCVGLASDDRVNLWCHTAQWSVQEGQVWKTVSSVVSPLEAFYFTLYDALEEEKSFFGRKMSFNNPSSDTSLTLWFVGDNGFTLESSCQEINNTVEFLPSRLQRVLFKSEIVNGSSNPTPKKLSDLRAPPT